MTPCLRCPDSYHSADTWPDIIEEVLGAKPSSSTPLALRPLLLNFWPDSTHRLFSGSGLHTGNELACWTWGIKRIKKKKKLEEK